MSGRREPGEVKEWVAYLRDIGVRELRVAGPGTDRQTDTAPVRSAAAEAGSLFLSPEEGRLAEATTLEEVRRVLGDCTRCKLHSGRTNLVFGRSVTGGPTPGTHGLFERN